MEDILIRAGQLILSLTILVSLHEMGHLVAAKKFGIRVDKFRLFFDFLFPFPGIAKWTIFNFDYKGTNYGVGWFPFGGYVQIAGMVDETTDAKELEKPAEAWEFRSKPAWQRLIVMIGGVAVNAVLAVLIYAMVMFVWGETYLPNESLKDGIWVTDDMAKDMGFENGDKILSVNDKEVVKFSEIMLEMIYGGTVQVERNGIPKTIEIPTNLIEQIIDKKKPAPFFMPRTPFKVGGFPEESSAKEAGMLEGDEIIAVNGTKITYFDEIKTELAKNKGKSIDVTLLREGGNLTLTMPVSDEGKLGFAPTLYSIKDMKKAGIYDFNVQEYGILSAFPAGYAKAVDKLDMYVKQFKLLLNPSTGAYKGMGGFGSIGKMFPTSWDWQVFWEMTAFLSVILAFMNLLPIPMLDGGYVVLLLIEMITRKAVPDKVLEYINMVGMAFIILLLVYTNGNDIFRAFR